MDMRPQNPALCSPQGMSPPWKARAGAGGVSPGSPSVISCSRGCSCCSRAVLRADSLPRGASTARCHPGSGVRSRDRLLPCHAGGRWNRRMKALGAGCSPPQLPTGCSPRGPSAGWRPYMASRPTRGRGSHTGSPCPGKGPRALSPGPATTTTPPRGSQPRGHSGTSPRPHSRAPRCCRDAFFSQARWSFSKPWESRDTSGQAREHLRFLRWPAGRAPAPPRLPAAIQPRWTPTPRAVGCASPPCTVPGGSERFQTTFSGRHGPGSQARRPGRSPPPRFPQPSFPPLPLSALMTSTWASGSPSQASQHCLKSPNLEEI